MPPVDIDYNFNPAIFDLHDDEVVRVVYTLPNQENRLWGYCQENDIVCYLPLQKVVKAVRQTHGGKSYQYPKELLRPMFSNYAFVKLSPFRRSELFRSNAVIRILQESDVRQQQLLEEIRTVHRVETVAMSEQLDFNAKVKVGDRFLIESGPWQGTYGWLKKKKDIFLWTVEIECVNSLIQATIDPSLYLMTPAPPAQK